MVIASIRIDSFKDVVLKRTVRRLVKSRPLKSRWDLFHGCLLKHAIPRDSRNRCVSTKTSIGCGLSLQQLLDSAVAFSEPAARICLLLHLIDTQETADRRADRQTNGKLVSAAHGLPRRHSTSLSFSAQTRPCKRKRKGKEKHEQITTIPLRGRQAFILIQFPLNWRARFLPITASAGLS